MQLVIVFTRTREILVTNVSGIAVAEDLQMETVMVVTVTHHGVDLTANNVPKVMTGVDLEKWIKAPVNVTVLTHGTVNNVLNVTGTVMEEDHQNKTVNVMTVTVKPHGVEKIVRSVLKPMHLVVLMDTLTQ